MKVLNIQNYSLTPKYNNNYQSQPIATAYQSENYGNLPTTAQYLSFMGGYSLNLGETVKNLDKLAEKNPEIYPANIREWLSLVLENGNKAKETLISVHKKYFASLEDCDTLEQIKALFPEFKGVKSAFDVETAKGKESLISKFQEGKSEYFESDEDLSVQLIKLYWGQGFSLNDLKRYADGTNLYYTMKKLEIPIASRDYGHVLKISDPEYNERLTHEMTEKRLAALDRKAQEQDGEPVFIPQHRHLSPEHKQRISEGLHKYYESNPDRIYNMSDRQKKFYRDNPEKANELTKVLKIAWNVFGAENIKKAMSKHFKRFGMTFDPTTNPANMTKDQSNAMRLFWANNEWAKKSFSKNMKFAYKKVREDKDVFYEVDITPRGFQHKFFEWAKAKGLDTSKFDFKFRIYKHDQSRDTGMGDVLSKYTPRFIDEYERNDQSKVMANTYLLALINASKDIKMLIKGNTSPEIQDMGRLLRIHIKDALFEPGEGLFRPVKQFDAPDIQRVYSQCVMMTILIDRPQQFLKIFENNLNKAYFTVDTNGDKPLMITQTMLEGVLR